MHVTTMRGFNRTPPLVIPPLAPVGAPPSDRKNSVFRGLVPLSETVETSAKCCPLVAEKKLAKWSISRKPVPPLRSSPSSLRCMRPRRFAPGALFRGLVPLSDAVETSAYWCPIVAEKKFEKWSISKKADFWVLRGGAPWRPPSKDPVMIPLFL